MSWITRAGVEEPRDNSPNGADVQLPTTSDNTDEWLKHIRQAFIAELIPFNDPKGMYVQDRADEFMRFISQVVGQLERKHAAEIQAMLAKLLEEGRRMYTSPGVTRMSFFAVPSQVIEAELNHLTTEKKKSNQMKGK
jgi:hypothetical protein